MLFYKKQFIIAYKWLYNETTEKAKRIYDQAIACGDKEFITETIEEFKNQFDYSFWFD